jgi:hypothetical protein
MQTIATHILPAKRARIASVLLPERIISVSKLLL